MALPKLFNLITWHNNTTPAINEDNLNAMSKGLSDVDDRLIGLAGTIMEDVPQIQEDIEELEEDFALIDEKIADATAEANRATTKANEAAASVISAGNKALISEGYAKGTQNGTPVGSSSPYYHNNAEYFKEQARSFTPTGYQDLVDDVAEAQEAITDIEGEKVSSNDAYVLRQCKGNSVDLGLVGGSVAWNQLVQNGNLADTSNWTAQGGTFTVSSNKAVLTTNGSLGYIQIYQPIVIPANHVCLTSWDYDVTNAPSVTTTQVTVRNGSDYTPKVAKSITGKGHNSGLFKVANNTIDLRFALLKTTSGNIPADEVGYLSNIVVHDLTQLFGSSEIADYIYSLEQATAGAGVAWFRQYFSNLYYGYDPGSIQSVNPSYRKVVGINLLPPMPSMTAGQLTMSVIDGVISFIGTSNALFYNGYSLPEPILLKKGKHYKFGKLEWSGTKPGLSNIALLTPDNSRAIITLNLNSDYEVLDYTPTEDIYVGIVAVYIPAGTTNINNVKVYPILADADAWKNTYEPYKESTYAFDSSKQLRGIPKLVDNKLSYDGDIYTADGTVTRKYGIVDLGTLTWTYYSDNNYYISDSLANIIRRVTDNASISNWLLCDKTISNAANNVYLGNIGVAVASNGRLYYKDENTSSTTPPTSNLVYELATPTTESANTYQNPQRAFIDGTEEFVDAGVTASTRDVSIPVGNMSEYNTSVVVPISQDYTDGAMEILKEIVASSSDFADFKTKVAAL